jgi:hypothetical protein
MAGLTSFPTPAARSLALTCVMPLLCSLYARCRRSPSSVRPQRARAAADPASAPSRRRRRPPLDSPRRVLPCSLLAAQFASVVATHRKLSTARRSGSQSSQHHTPSARPRRPCCCWRTAPRRRPSLHMSELKVEDNPNPLMYFLNHV